MRLRVINPDRLIYLFENITIINYFIKIKDIAIVKNAFYNIKKRLIEYVITLIENGKYKNENVRYTIDRIDKQIIPTETDKEHVETLIALTIYINDKSFGFHQKMSNYLLSLLKDKINFDELEQAVYERKESDFEDENPDIIRQRYIDIVNKLAEMEWCIYRIIDDFSFFRILKNRYNIDKISNPYKTILKPKNPTVSVKLKGIKKRSEPFLLSELRYNTNSFLRHIFGKQLIMNYNLK